jgi:hypothetical protein
MIIQDDRAKEETETHSSLIVGTDSFMSGWGKAEGGKSYAAWACKPEYQRIVQDWVENRSEMKRVRVVGSDYRPTGKGHCHIYVVRENHPSIAYLNERKS